MSNFCNDYINSNFHKSPCGLEWDLKTEVNFLKVRHTEETHRVLEVQVSSVTSDRHS